MTERTTGTVINWNSFLGVGFIERDFCGDNESNIYVESKAVRKGCTFKLELGLRVEFAIAPGTRGLKAEDVTQIN